MLLKNAPQYALIFLMPFYIFCTGNGNGILNRRPWTTKRFDGVLLCKTKNLSAAFTTFYVGVMSRQEISEKAYYFKLPIGLKCAFVYHHWWCIFIAELQTTLVNWDSNIELQRTVLKYWNTFVNFKTENFSLKKLCPHFYGFLRGKPSPLNKIYIYITTEYKCTAVTAEQWIPLVQTYGQGKKSWRMLHIFVKNNSKIC